jgi:flagellar motility protein MotE (MotC chaperone)
MKLHPTTLLIVAMFGSFAIILTVMIAVFRPEHRPPRRRIEPVVVRPQVRDTVQHVVASAPTMGITQQPKEPQSDPIASTQSPIKQMKTIPKSAETSRQLYYQLEREQQEMVQLRIDMEKRLKTALSEHNQKLAQLARRCEALESGEAAQILIDLSDDDVAGVLRQMQSEKAASVNVLLKRLGRDVGKIK